MGEKKKKDDWTKACVLLQSNLESSTRKWNGQFEMGMLIQKAYDACQWNLPVLGHSSVMEIH